MCVVLSICVSESWLDLCELLARFSSVAFMSSATSDKTSAKLCSSTLASSTLCARNAVWCCRTWLTTSPSQSTLCSIAVLVVVACVLVSATAMSVSVSSWIYTVRLVEIMKDLVITQRRLQSNVYLPTDTVLKRISSDTLPKNLVAEDHEIFNDKLKVVKFSKGDVGYEETAELRITVRHRAEQGNEAFQKFFRKLKQSQFNIMVQSRMADHDSVPLDKNNRPRPLPVYEEVFCKPEPQSLPGLLLRSGSSSAPSVFGTEDVEDTPAKRQKLDRNSSDPDLGASSFGFGAKADSSAKKSRYSAGTAESAVDEELQALREDFGHLLDNLWDEDRRKSALGQRVVNNKAVELKQIVEKARATKNQGILELAVHTRDGWNAVDVFLKACKDYGFDLKVPRPAKIHMFMRRYTEILKFDFVVIKLGPDVTTAYHTHQAIKSIESKDYKFEGVKVRKHDLVGEPFDHFGVEDIMLHQASVASAVTDRALSSVCANQHEALKAWLSYLHQEDSDQFSEPQLAKNIEAVWRVSLQKPDESGNFLSSLEQIEAFDETDKNTELFLRTFKSHAESDAILTSARALNDTLITQQQWDADIKDFDRFTPQLCEMLSKVDLLVPVTEDTEVQNAEAETKIHTATLNSFLNKHIEISNKIRALGDFDRHREGYDGKVAQLKSGLCKVAGLFLVRAMATLNSLCDAPAVDAKTHGQTIMVAHLREGGNALLANLKSFMALPGIKDLAQPIVGQPAPVLTARETVTFLETGLEFVDTMLAAATEAIGEVGNMTEAFGTQLLSKVTAGDVQARKALAKLCSANAKFTSSLGSSPQKVQDRWSEHYKALHGVFMHFQHDVQPALEAGFDGINKDLMDSVSSLSCEQCLAGAGVGAVVAVPGTELPGLEEMIVGLADSPILAISEKFVLAVAVAEIVSPSSVKPFHLLRALEEYKRCFAGACVKVKTLMQKTLPVPIRSAEACVAANGSDSSPALEQMQELVSQFELICTDVREGYAKHDSARRAHLPGDDGNPDASGATSQLLKLLGKAVLGSIGSLFSLCATSIPANWEVLLGTRQERKIWEGIPEDKYALSCTLMGVCGTFTDTCLMLKIREKALITDQALMADIAQKTEQVMGFRRYSVSVMAADRILTEVMHLKTAKSRKDALERSVVHVYLFVLCLCWWGGDWTDWFVVERLVGLCVYVCTSDSYDRFQAEMKTLGVMEMPSVVKAWWLAEINAGKQ